MAAGTHVASSVRERRKTWMDASDPRYRAVQELAAYWMRHPHSSDTLEGICRWWLTDTSLTPERVEQALAWLVERNVVVAQTTADGRVRYRLAGDASPDLS
jgi:hypothetical protein